MVTQQRAKDQIWDEEFAATRAFLAEYGISPRNVDEYAEEDVIKAIQRRGWECSIERDDEAHDWVAEITERRTVSQSQTAVGHDPDRTMALLRALRFALMWMPPEEYWRVFDEHARTLLGMSGEEFLQRLDSGELSPDDDSRVFHLTIMRPRGT